MLTMDEIRLFTFLPRVPLGRFFTGSTVISQVRSLSKRWDNCTNRNDIGILNWQYCFAHSCRHDGCKHMKIVPCTCVRVCVGCKESRATMIDPMSPVTAMQAYSMPEGVAGWHGVKCTKLVSVRLWYILKSIIVLDLSSVLQFSF